MKYPTVYRTIQVDGISICYREAGPKDAPTLLLLHGLPSSSRMFEPLFAGFPIAIALSRPITPDSDTVTGQTRNNSRTRSITSPKP
jgi:pimeloyl-ACP methyl ester carboxylesterase